MYFFLLFRGGMSNIVYLCYLSKSVPIKPNEQRQVLLRIYGEIIKDNPETVVTDSVIYALLAERKLGPKLYGVFTGGRIEEYVHVSTHTIHYGIYMIHHACTWHGE